jgi:hypothetical protein
MKQFPGIIWITRASEYCIKYMQELLSSRMAGVAQHAGRYNKEWKPHTEHVAAR